MATITCVQRSSRLAQSSRYASIASGLRRAAQAAVVAKLYTVAGRVSRTSAPAISRVRPRAREQRHVVVGVGADAEVERHFVEERRVRERDAAAAEVVGDAEHEPVAPPAEGVAR